MLSQCIYSGIGISTHWNIVVTAGEELNEMNIAQTARLLCLLPLFFVQFSVRCDSRYIRGKDFITAEEIRYYDGNQENFEVNNEKFDCGADNHDAGCANISKKARRSSHFNQLTWNIDRLDQRHLPLDGEFCPLADGTGVDVYSIDSGINYDHEVFNGRASFGGYDAFGGNGRDCDGLGTHVAGLSVGNPTGVAHGAHIYSIKFVDCASIGLYRHAKRGIYHAIKRAKKSGRRSVIILSFELCYLDKAVRDAISNNIVVVTAAGRPNVKYCGYGPYNIPGVINVGAIQQAVDDRYPGKHMLTAQTNYAGPVHIFAPGENIFSASYRSNTKLVSRSGTPTACGIVVGVVATLLQRFPDYTPHQIEEQLIRESTKDVINFHTRNGQNLSSIIAETLPNRLAYTGKCINKHTGPPGLRRLKGRKGKQGDMHRVPRSKDQKEKRRK